MANLFIIINLREGDMVSIIEAHRSKDNAYQRLLNYIENNDTSTCWWKILPVEVGDNDSGTYDIVVRVSWGSSNRVRFVGLFQPNTVPDRYDGDKYFVERLVIH